nr:PREDICTED: uncharacterized protein LOC109042509 [Bemisia tabaci]
MEDSPFLCLEHLAMLRSAVLMWEQPQIQAKINEYFRTEYSCKQPKQKKEKWNDLTREVVQLLSLVPLPPSIHCEMVHIVRSLGERLFYWTKYAKNMSIASSDFSKPVFWTPMGTIDQVRIIKTLCSRGGPSNVCSLYQLACNNCLEEYVEYLWQQVPREVQEGPFYLEGIYQQAEFHLVAYWKFFMEGKLSFLVNLLKHMSLEASDFYILNHPVHENMFRLAVVEGYHAATKYFWAKLDDEQRERNLLKCAILSIEKSNEVLSGNLFSYKNHVHVDILVFLLWRMSRVQRLELYSRHKNTVLKMLLYTWPWQGLFLCALEEMWPLFSEQDYQSLMHSVMSRLTQDAEQGYPLHHNKFHRIFQAVWRATPPHLKQSVDRNCWQVLSVLFKVEDISSISMIVNDPDLRERRHDLIAEGKSYFTNLIKEEKFELLEQCMEELHFSEEEQNSLKSQIHINIDYMRFIKQEEYERVDKYLAWAMKKQEDRLNLKQKLRCSPFSVAHICTLWSVPLGDLSDAKHRSAKFLDWLFDAEEDQLAFKINHLTLSELHAKIITKFIPFNHFEIVEPFLEWCLLTHEEIQDLKARVVAETAASTCKRLVSADLLFVVEHFLAWAFAEADRREFAQADRREFAQQFILSEDGVMAACNLVRKCRSINASRAARLEKFEMLFNLFLHSLETKEVFKVRYRMYVNEFISGRVVEDYLFFFDVLDAFEVPAW